MTATTSLEVWTGGSSGSVGSKTDVSNMRFRTDDSPSTIDTTNPIKIPDSGINQSFWVSLAMNWSGTYDEISNIRFYTDGSLSMSLGTDGQIVIGSRDSGDIGCPENSYEPATGTVGETGDDLGSTHAYYSGQSTPEDDAFTYTSGSPAQIDSNTYTTDGSSYAAVLQVDVDTDASAGIQTSETFTFLYDEI